MHELETFQGCTNHGNSRARSPGQSELQEPEPHLSQALLLPQPSPDPSTLPQTLPELFWRISWDRHPLIPSPLASSPAGILIVLLEQPNSSAQVRTGPVPCPAPRSLSNPAQKRGQDPPNPPTAQGKFHGHQTPATGGGVSEAQSAPPQILCDKNSCNQSRTRSCGHFLTATPVLCLSGLPLGHLQLSVTPKPPQTAQENHKKRLKPPKSRCSSMSPKLSWFVPWLVQISWSLGAALPLFPRSCAGPPQPSLAQTPGTGWPTSASPRLPKTHITRGFLSHFV